MRDWRFFSYEPDWAEVRMKYTTERHITNSFTELPLFHCPDLCIQPDDIAVRTRIYEEVIFILHNSTLQTIYVEPTF